jgi:ribonuclease PH
MTDSKSTLRRADSRAADVLRPVRIEVGPMKFAEGSALIEMGDTRVLAAATVENRVPPFLADSNQGWATAEYSMLPAATPTRSTREVRRGRPSGRSSEIQRLIGRSLRAVLDLKALPERTLILDCDVLQADGGTRTAAITGAWIATVQALGRLFLTGDLPRWPVAAQVAAVSVGIVDGIPVLDLDAPEDQTAEVDMNVVATDQMLDLALKGIGDLHRHQRAAVASVVEEIEAASERHARRPAAPKDEKELWGRP